MENKRLISLTNACKKLGITKPTLTKYIREADYKVIKNGNQHLISYALLEEINVKLKLKKPKLDKQYSNSNKTKSYENDSSILHFKEEIEFLRNQIVQKDNQINALNKSVSELQNNIGNQLQLILIEKTENQKLEQQIKLIEDQPSQFNENLINEALEFSKRLHEELN